jgi:hypothetical protein
MMERRRRALRVLMRYWPYEAVALIFLASRLVYRVCYGVRFDPSPVSFYIQYADPWFLRHDFLRSILYLHHQAPLQNVLVGIPLLLMDDAHAFMVLDVVYVGLGLATALGLLCAMVNLGARAGWAVLICGLYACSPTTVIYESWLFYHLPVACLLIWALVALLRYYRARTFASAVAFFSAIAVAALFRSSLSLVYVGALLGSLLLWPPFDVSGRRSARKVILKAAAGPMLVLALVSVKPVFMIGYGYGEAMLWGNLSTKVWEQLPRAERDRLLAEGIVSPAVDVFCLTDLEHFGQLRMRQPPTGVPLLDMERAPSGRWNAHAIEYLPITRHYFKRDALYLLSHYPGAYLRGVASALSQYLAPCTIDMMLPITQSYLQLTGLRTSIDRFWGLGADNRSLVLTLVLPVLLLYGGYRIRRANLAVCSERRGAIGHAYVIATILYVAASTLLISLGDFSRYRYDVDPLYLVLLAVALSDGEAIVRAALTRVLRPAQTQA